MCTAREYSDISATGSISQIAVNIVFMTLTVKGENK
jgi:hypothetical protein